jgi:hypothetical protein
LRFARGGEKNFHGDIPFLLLRSPRAYTSGVLRGFALNQGLNEAGKRKVNADQ